MSALPPLIGHAAERNALAAAAEAGQLPHSILLHGPPGIGKQRLALWLGQLLLCQAFPRGEPCGECHACRLATRLEHPDLHWYFPLPRPKGTAADRLGEALEDARAAELGARRSQPLRASLPVGMEGIYLAQVQTLLKTAAARPAMGRHKVFVIGDAELLVSQEASPEAANALLKVLEEPPANTTIIVTAADPDLLLPTIRSRLLPVRLRPLTVAAAAEFLIRVCGLPPEEARRAAQLADGSVGRALGYLAQGDESAPLETIRQQGRTLLQAALDRSGAAAAAAALAETPSGARAGFSDALESLTLWLRDLGAAAGGAGDVVLNRDALPWLQEVARQLPDPAGIPAAITAVEETIQLTRFNINPQLATAALLRRVRSELLG